MHCNVCETPMGGPIFEASSQQALTSLCELRPGRARVWVCRACGHLRGEALPDTSAYYESDYRILLNHEDEDQIYEVRGERIVYRTDHQVSTLLDKLRLPDGARLLDYGCAKGSTPKRLLAHRPDLLVHLFDVSEMYGAHWDRFLDPARRAVHRTPPHWQGTFDAVTSLFALEHIPAPRETVQRVAALLKDDGVFYGIVPDAFGNVADFVVIDHVNHFTASSLHTLLSAAGFSQIGIDAEAHRGALVFLARKHGAPTVCPDVSATLARSLDLARYWTRLSERIRAAEHRQDDVAAAAIYGSGFYGAYIASTLRRPERVRCFLDRSPYQQGKTLFGKKIIAPEQLAEDIRTLYVGLNPAIARTTLANTEWLGGRDLALVFLDEGGP